MAPTYPLSTTPAAVSGGPDHDRPGQDVPDPEDPGRPSAIPTDPAPVRPPGDTADTV